MGYSKLDGMRRIMVDEYELLKALGKVEQRVRKIEDSITGAASFTLDRQQLNATVIDHLRWMRFEVQQAKELVSENAGRHKG
jgi:hypothetical protein